MKWLACLALIAPVSAFAACPPMSAYQVTGVSADSIPVSEAVQILFQGTAWKPEVSGDASNVRVTYRAVSGPLDRVYARVIEQAGKASQSAVSAVNDPTRCVTTVAVVAPPPALVVEPVAAVAVAAAAPVASAPPPPPAERPDTLRAGTNLSDALQGYVERRGWEMRWLIDQDYALDVDLPVPSMDLIEGVTWVVRAYQARGGMQGVVPRFHRGNNVVVIEKMTVREATQ